MRLLGAALFSAPGFVRIEGSHDGAFVSGSGLQVRAMSAPEVMNRMNWASLDILKMDIEGAEAEVLGQSADAWLGKVGMLIVELHGEDVGRTVMETMARNNFVGRRYRSLWYFNRRA